MMSTLSLGRAPPVPNIDQLRAKPGFDPVRVLEVNKHRTLLLRRPAKPWFDHGCPASLPLFFAERLQFARRVASAANGSSEAAARKSPHRQTASARLPGPNSAAVGLELVELFVGAYRVGWMRAWRSRAGKSPVTVRIWCDKGRAFD